MAAAAAIAPRKRIALVAHDNKKKDLLEWALYNREMLLRHELCATGATGAECETQITSSARAAAKDNSGRGRLRTRAQRTGAHDVGAAFANAAQWIVRLGRLGRDASGYMRKGHLKFLYPGCPAGCRGIPETDTRCPGACPLRSWSNWPEGQLMCANQQKLRGPVCMFNGVTVKVADPARDVKGVKSVENDIRVQ